MKNFFSNNTIANVNNSPENYLEEYEKKPKVEDLQEAGKVTLHKKSAFSPDVIDLQNNKETNQETKQVIVLSQSIESFFAYQEQKQENPLFLTHLEKLREEVEKEFGKKETVFYVSKDENKDQFDNPLDKHLASVINYKSYFDNLKKEKGVSYDNILSSLMNGSFSDSKLNEAIEYSTRLLDVLNKQIKLEENLKYSHQNLMNSIYDSNTNTLTGATYFTKGSVLDTAQEAKMIINEHYNNEKLLDKDVSSFIGVMQLPKIEEMVEKPIQEQALEATAGVRFKP